MPAPSPIEDHSFNIMGAHLPRMSNLIHSLCHGDRLGRNEDSECSLQTVTTRNATHTLTRTVPCIAWKDDMADKVWKCWYCLQRCSP